MSDDMSNNNDAHRVYTDASTAQRGERVINLGRRQTDLETEVRSGFKNIDTAVTSLAKETRASIDEPCGAQQALTAGAGRGADVRGDARRLGLSADP